MSVIEYSYVIFSEAAQLCIISIRKQKEDAYGKIYHGTRRRHNKQPLYLI